jgi:hypothetical protein
LGGPKGRRKILIFWDLHFITRPPEAESIVWVPEAASGEGVDEDTADKPVAETMKLLAQLSADTATTTEYANISMRYKTFGNI